MDRSGLRSLPLGSHLAERNDEKRANYIGDVISISRYPIDEIPWPILNSTRGLLHP
jgi:hypothetical protein